MSRFLRTGQSYVALSRATSLEGLQVIGFDAKKVMAHPKVTTWSVRLLYCLPLTLTDFLRLTAHFDDSRLSIEKGFKSHLSHFSSAAAFVFEHFISFLAILFTSLSLESSLYDLSKFDLQFSTFIKFLRWRPLRQRSISRCARRVRRVTDASLIGTRPFRVETLQFEISARTTVRVD